MLDPLGDAPAWLQSLAEPYTLRLNSPTLTQHIHEAILAFVFYLSVHYIVSPLLSPVLFPRSYPNLNPRTKLNWDIHAVSLIQSVIISGAALWVMFTDNERSSMTAGERVFGYTGACGLIQALALGYFVYDLIVSVRYFNLFGIGMLFHAISALWVFSLGFRPFLNYYAPTFILYELSSPFLNIHWFLDKISMTGSKAQWYNGMALLSTFFCCRLLWGSWQSVRVYSDMWYALQQTWTAASSGLETPASVNAVVFQVRDGAMCIDETCARANAQITQFKDFTATGVPTWLVLTYVASNVVLNFLNYYWFSKMVETVLKRFRVPPAETEAKKKEAQKFVEDITIQAAAKLEKEEGSLPAAAEASGAELVEEARRRKVDLVSKVPLPGS
ncbi:hypothetical protein N7495_001686 [Penicillium taxi]|uniref:uncharacterized protein n=1 Tax=Penicillium taxi TaxID=168475 RepID=UPI0025452F1F|nr:uncharacterized protein N7495_001686 [Penicillium taxi]KAJ5909004.1 hypothetical protein N7495_001686 [Penicillium taxi]